MEIRYNHRLWKRDYEKALEFLAKCKNKDGKTVTESYMPKMGLN